MKCESCDGTGWDPWEFEECVWCAGSGGSCEYCGGSLIMSDGTVSPDNICELCVTNGEPDDAEADFI